MKELIEHIIDLMTEFDEMGFVPTTTVPCSPEAYAIKWRDAMAKDLIDLRKQSEWISVTERLPESGARVLGYSEIVGDMRCYEICKGRCDNTLQWWSETGWATVQDLLVTHWMPLPQPPEMRGGE